jgi:hypothetical protein
MSAAKAHARESSADIRLKELSRIPATGYYTSPVMTMLRKLTERKRNRRGKK